MSFKNEHIKSQPDGEDDSQALAGQGRGAQGFTGAGVLVAVPDGRVIRELKNSIDQIHFSVEI